MKTVLSLIALMVLSSAGAGQLTNNTETAQSSASHYYESSDKIAYYFHLIQVNRWQDSVIAANNNRIASLLTSGQ